MSWVRLDDQVPRHRKILLAGPAAAWLWVCGLAHASSQLTDGFIADEALPLLGVVKGTAALAARLVDAGLWERRAGGFQIHDFLDYNASRVAVLAKRSEDAARKRRTDSTRIPTGLRAESTGPRARDPIPSDPIPSDPDKGASAPLSTRATIRPLIGRNPHLTCGACDPTLARCVPGLMHDKFANALAVRHGGDREAAKAALLAWYPRVWARLADTFVMGDACKFWQAQFDAAFADRAPVPPAATSSRTGAAPAGKYAAITQGLS